LTRHAGKMGGAARSSDDDFNAALLGGGSVFKKKIGRAMSGDDACFMWNTEFAERFGGELHGVPIRPEPMMMPTRG